MNLPTVATCSVVVCWHCDCYYLVDYRDSQLSRYTLVGVSVIHYGYRQCPYISTAEFTVTTLLMRKNHACLPKWTNLILVRLRVVVVQTRNFDPQENALKT